VGTNQNGGLLIVGARWEIEEQILMSFTSYLELMGFYNSPLF
jgi:hypothetical protein